MRNTGGCPCRVTHRIVKRQRLRHDLGGGRELDLALLGQIGDDPKGAVQFTRLIGPERYRQDMDGLARRAAVADSKVAPWRP